MQNPEHLLPDDPDQPVVLIAEDEPMIQNIARITLEREGYFVLTAGNGEVALRLSQQYPGKIHLLLADIVMPKMSGVELSNRILTERPGIRIVLMSGHTFAEKIDPTFPFLQKPFDLKDLKDTVRLSISAFHGTGP